MFCVIFKTIVRTTEFLILLALGVAVITLSSALIIDSSHFSSTTVSWVFYVYSSIMIMLTATVLYFMTDNYIEDIKRYFY